MTKKKRDYAATGIGIVTSLVMALTLINFDTFDYTSVNQWVKLLVVCLPAIQGKITTMKKGGDVE